MSIVLSAIFLFVFGFLWYGPLFGKKWLVLMRFTPEEMASMKARGMKKAIFTAVIINLMIAVSLGYIFSRLFVLSFEELLRTIFVVWLAFTFPVYANSALWEGKSVKLVLFNAVYSLISFGVVTAIIYYMQ